MTFAAEESGEKISKDAARGADTSQEPPEIACDVTRRALSFDWKSTQIGEYIMPRCKLLVPAAIFAVLVGGAGVVSAYTGEELAKDAKVTLAEARAIALKAFPGKITDEELEKEKGGSGLRYSFDIKNGGVTHEVGVDAKTGKLLENSVEGPHAD
jgi:hypothetical protein